MNKHNILLLTFITLLLTGCGYGLENTPSEPESPYQKIFTFTYNDKECSIYVAENVTLYYSNIYTNKTMASNFTFSYEYHPMPYIDNDMEDSLVDELYLKANENIDIINDFYNYDLCAYSHKDKYYFENSITNEKEEEISIALIEKYINFTINYDRDYYHLSIPMELTFLKQYKDQIQDFDNTNYISFSDFIQNYNIKVKGE